MNKDKEDEQHYLPDNQGRCSLRCYTFIYTEFNNPFNSKHLELIMASSNEMLTNYLNGNIQTVRDEIKLDNTLFYDLFSLYLDMYDPKEEDLKLFVKRLTL